MMSEGAREVATLQQKDWGGERGVPDIASGQLGASEKRLIWQQFEPPNDTTEDNPTELTRTSLVQTLVGIIRHKKCLFFDPVIK